MIGSSITIKRLKLLGVLILGLLIFVATSLLYDAIGLNRKFSETAIRKTIEKCSCVEEIQMVKVFNIWKEPSFRIVLTIM